MKQNNDARSIREDSTCSRQFLQSLGTVFGSVSVFTDFAYRHLCHDTAVSIRL